LTKLFKDIKQYPWLIRYLDECFITLSSIFIVLERFEEARNILEQANKLCEHYSLNALLAKSKIILLSLDLQIDIQSNSIPERFNEIEELFKKSGLKEGLHELTCLKNIYEDDLFMLIRQKELTNLEKFQNFKFESCEMTDQI
jgi:hypothetical protein